MKRFLYLVGCLFFVLNIQTTSAQQTDNQSINSKSSLALFTQNQKLQAKVLQFCSVQKERLLSINNEKKQHYLLFKSIHKYFLKEYKNYQRFEATLTEGTYDCLTAVSLYAVILENLGYDFSIQETQYHVYTLIHLEAGGKILVETTDPEHGFVIGEKAINNKIKGYEQAEKQTQIAYQSKQNFSQHIDIQQLAGLLHYNCAVIDFNTQDFEQAIKKLDRSLDLYQSKRAKELLMLAIAYLPNDQQDHYFDKYQFEKEEFISLGQEH